MHPKALTLAGAAVAVAIVTYVVLNVVAPFEQPQEQLPPGTSAESVFAGTLGSGEATEVAAASGESAVAPPVPGAAPIEAPPDTTTPAPKAAAAPGSETGSGDSADAPPPSFDSVGDSDSAAEPAMSAVEPDAEDSAEAAPPDVGAVEPAAPAAEAEPAPASTPAPTAAESAPPAAPAPAPAAESAPAQTAQQAPPKKPARRTAPAADALKQWWPEQSVPGRLNLLYAGQAANTRALALLFDGQLADAAAAGQHIQVIRSDGSTVEPRWKLNANNRMLLLEKLSAGRYTVVLKPELAGSNGNVLSTELHGPVYIR